MWDIILQFICIWNKWIVYICMVITDSIIINQWHRIGQPNIIHFKFLMVTRYIQSTLLRTKFYSDSHAFTSQKTTYVPGKYKQSVLCAVYFRAFVMIKRGKLNKYNLTLLASILASELKTFKNLERLVLMLAHTLILKHCFISATSNLPLIASFLPLSLMYICFKVYCKTFTN